MGSRERRRVMSVVYRIQDADGRGPWKPGLSRFWVVPRMDHENLLPWTCSVTKTRLSDWQQKYRFLGCACKTADDLRRWFLREEYETVRRMGYQAVKLVGCDVLWQDETQCVIARRQPLWRGAISFDLYDEAKRFEVAKRGEK